MVAGTDDVGAGKDQYDLNSGEYARTNMIQTTPVQMTLTNSVSSPFHKYCDCLHQVFSPLVGFPRRQIAPNVGPSLCKFRRSEWSRQTVLVTTKFTFFSTNEIICPQELAAQLQTAWIFSFDETNLQNPSGLKVQL